MLPEAFSTYEVSSFIFNEIFVTPKMPLLNHIPSLSFQFMVKAKGKKYSQTRTVKSREG